VVDGLNMPGAFVLLGPKSHQVLAQHQLITAQQQQIAILQEQVVAQQHVAVQNSRVH
jgi:hypothetical protein